MKADLIRTHEAGGSCTFRTPSQPASPPTAPTLPDFPFSHIIANFFHANTTYLAMADRYSNWLSVYRLEKDDSGHINKII